jgi:hypothetical protein
MHRLSLEPKYIPAGEEIQCSEAIDVNSGSSSPHSRAALELRDLKRQASPHCLGR